MAYNIQFPLRDETSKPALFEVTTTIRNGIRSELILLLLTQKGERWMNPDYGTNLKKYLFEPNDNITEQDMTDDIKLSVQTYLPRLSMDKVTYTYLQRNQIQIDLMFSYGSAYFRESDKITITISE